MEVSLIFEYIWVFFILIALEGLLAADNAVVLAIMVKPLPEKDRKKALFYGLAGAFLLRFISLFAISFLVNVWQVQALGAIYLLYMSINQIIRKVWLKKDDHHDKEKTIQKKKTASLWGTVLKVELADMAFAIDSILAAVALAVALPNTGFPNIGSLDGGKFLVILAGGFVGLVIMRFAANVFVSLLNKKPGLEIAAFVIVGWVGVKLLITTLSHPALGILPETFISSTEWKIIFYLVLVLIALGGWFLSKEKKNVKKVA